MKENITLYASAPSLEAIQQSIEKFYCGTKVTLTQGARDNFWTIANSTRTIPDMRVRKLRNRYRFELVQP